VKKPDPAPIDLFIKEFVKFDSSTLNPFSDIPIFEPIPSGGGDTHEITPEKEADKKKEKSRERTREKAKEKPKEKAREKQKSRQKQGEKSK